MISMKRLNPFMIESYRECGAMPRWEFAVGPLPRYVPCQPLLEDYYREE